MSLRNIICIKMQIYSICSFLDGARCASGNRKMLDRTCLEQLTFARTLI